MMRRDLIGVGSFIVVVLLLAVAGCERNSMDVGGKAETTVPQPAYSVAANVSLVPGEAHVAEAFPAIGGTATIDPAALFQGNCMACHQATGAGIPGVFPPLDGSEYVLGNTERLASIMLYGLKGPITVKGTEYNNVMAGLGVTLNDEQLAAIANHVRSSWSNSAEEKVTPEVFKAMREKWGSRAQLEISELNAALGIDPAS